MLKSTRNKGFQLTFDNGWTISVQFGIANYCSNRDYTASFDKEMQQDTTISKNAEIAVWCSHDKWLSFREEFNDDVLGWLSADEVAQWITKVAAFEPCRIAVKPPSESRAVNL